MASALHLDGCGTCSAVHCLLKGQKQVTLVHPHFKDQCEKLLLDSQWWREALLTPAEWQQLQDTLPQGAAQRFFMSAGDMLIINICSWHEFLNVEQCISIAWDFMCPLHGESASQAKAISAATSGTDRPLNMQPFHEYCTQLRVQKICD
jgi:hypothetical protein